MLLSATLDRVVVKGRTRLLRQLAAFSSNALSHPCHLQPSEPGSDETRWTARYLEFVRLRALMDKIRLSEIYQPAMHRLSIVNTIPDSLRDVASGV